jgi:hypothetical protein
MLSFVSQPNLHARFWSLGAGYLLPANDIRCREARTQSPVTSNKTPVFMLSTSHPRSYKNGSAA